MSSCIKNLFTVKERIWGEVKFKSDKKFFITQADPTTLILKLLPFPGNSAGKESAWDAGDPGLIPGSGSSPEEGIGYPLQYSWASLVPHMVKNLLAMRETWVWSLGWKYLLEKGMATYSSILVWRIPWTEEPGGLQSMGSQRIGYNWVTNTTPTTRLK